MDLLIIKKVSGERLSEREEQILNEWLDSSVENRKAYFELKLAFTKTDKKELDLFRNQVWSQANKQVMVRERVFTLPNMLKWAAVFLLVSSLGWLVLDQTVFIDSAKDQMAYVEKISLPGQKITTVLPDGTRVKLNSGSKLIVPEEFEQDRREVELIGEAFFDVVPDASRPFIIHTSELDVRVLGTSFNVDAYPESKKKNVAVRSGKVRVNGKLNSSVDLVAHQMVILDEEGKLKEVEAFDPELEFGWINQKLVFKSSSFEDIVFEVERWYDVEISISPDIIPSDSFTGSFENVTVTELLGSLTKVYQLNYTINGSEIIIYKEKKY